MNINIENHLNIHPGKKYRLIKAPEKEIDGLPKIGAIGTCKWTSSIAGAGLDFDGKEIILPYNCIEEVKEDGIPDAILITIMMDNPQGVLKILKGLWRMTKQQNIRDLMECGVLSTDEDAQCKIEKSYEEKWGEYIDSLQEELHSDIMI